MKHSWPVINLKTVDSTNNYANLLVSENVHFNECVISTWFQTNGRGQGNNHWHSEDAKNLMFSLLLNTKYLLAEEQFMLSQTISLSIVELLKNYGIKAKIKWPNDILVDSKKIAGILIENSIQGCCLFSSVVGIGLNVNQIDFEKIETFPTSMKLLNSQDYHCDSLLDELLDIIWSRITLLKEGHLQNLKNEYLEHLYKYQSWQKFTKDNQAFEGKIIDVTNFGELVILSGAGKVQKFMMHEIKMIL